MSGRRLLRNLAGVTAGLILATGGIAASAGTASAAPATGCGAMSSSWRSVAGGVFTGQLSVDGGPQAEIQVDITLGDFGIITQLGSDTRGVTGNFRRTDDVNGKPAWTITQADLAYILTDPSCSGDRVASATISEVRGLLSGPITRILL